MSSVPSQRRRWLSVPAQEPFGPETRVSAGWVWEAPRAKALLLEGHFCVRTPWPDCPSALFSKETLKAPGQRTVRVGAAFLSRRHGARGTLETGVFSSWEKSAFVCALPFWVGPRESPRSQLQTLLLASFGERQAWRGFWIFEQRKGVRGDFFLLCLET